MEKQKEECKACGLSMKYKRKNKEYSNMVIFHADDYGMTPKQSERILHCYQKGCLNRISIIPNSPHLKECVKLLPPDLPFAIHINLAEGPCCADKEKIPRLINKSGYFKLSFLQLLLSSFIRPKSLYKQIKEECMAQIKAVYKYENTGRKVFLDSHMHYHMIPIVFYALYTACKELEKERNIKIETIRWPVEPIRPVIKNRKVWKNISGVNIIKNVVLHLCAFIDAPILEKAGWKDKTAVFFGILFTGNMNLTVVKSLLSEFQKYADDCGKDLEVLLHPGWISPDEDLPGFRFFDFQLSKKRKEESKTLLFINKKTKNER